MQNVKELARFGLMIAILEVSKLILTILPNIELVSFWIILFALVMGYRTLYAVYGFVSLEGLLYGIHFWWVAYLYVWTLLVFIVQLFRKQQSALFWAIISGSFGLSFGALCAIPYLITGILSGGIWNGILSGFSWWIAGVPYDILHCCGNFITMLILYHPMRNAMKRIT